MSYSVYLVFKDISGKDKSIRVFVNSQDMNRAFSQIEKLPEKEIPQYNWEPIEINAESFRLSRKILKSFNTWGLCFPNFKNKQGLFLMIGPSSAGLFTNRLRSDDLKRSYDITVRYIGCQKT